MAVYCVVYFFVQSTGKVNLTKHDESQSKVRFQVLKFTDVSEILAISIIKAP